MFANKQAAEFPGRSFYKPRGGPDWGRFLPWLLLTLIAAVLLAYGMAELFRVGHYYIVIVPLITGLAVAGLVRVAVAKGHCRNPGIAGAAGATAGLLLYFGYYYFGMVNDLKPLLGPEVVRRLDLMPQYIRFRMATQVTRDIHHHRDEDENTPPKRHDVVFNWIFFATEIIMVLAFTTGAGIQRSRKTYCQACGKWMVRDVTHFEPSQSTELLAALRSSSGRALAALCAKPPYATIPSTMLGADFCPSIKEGTARDCPVYVSVKNVAQAINAPTLDRFDASKGKLLLRGLQLSPDEIAALGTRFTVFESIAGRAAIHALKPAEPDSAAAAANQGAVAEITPVESHSAGKVLTRRAAWIGSSFLFVGLVMIFASICLAGWGGMMAFPDKKTVEEVPPAKKTVGIALLSVGVACFAGTAVFFFFNPSFFGDRYLRKRARLEFSRRSKCLVDPNDPDALFVEIVPKLNWGKLKLESASDVGFLKVDPRRREVLFEGDKEQFRIPAAAITSCAVEVHVEGQGSAAATRIYFVVIQARRPDAFWEAPIRERAGSGMFRSRKRKRRTERLFQSIQEIRGVAVTG